MQYYDSKLFGSIYSPNRFEELIELLEQRGPIRIWRGQSNVAWPVHSAAYRRLRIDRTFVDEGAVARYESHLLEAARHKGFGFLEGRRLADLELLARLQHHGAATRLVDASRSALVALFFAAAKEFELSGLFFGVSTDALGGFEGILNEQSYTDAFKNLPKGHPQVYEAPAVSSRIAAQRAEFLYSPVVDHQTGSLALGKEGDTLFIHLSAELKRSALKSLSQTYDISHATLFPDLDGFGYSQSYHFSTQTLSRW